ncbi:DMT family transporter [Vallitalea pronyensis]|uniref:DMT family transporter n=1 Tax=Vallitalea pronyensis TaxID=1348613 RepID=A0A8J8SID9_9FIRM|nr:DMT family transporter [Vallitalea pronyensis]QUI24820.1 DMT family transporter [Vallitalea pronyensis]
MFILLALLAGALVIICISINGNLAKQVGVIQAGMTNYFVGLMSSILYATIMGGLSWHTLFMAPHSIPFYYFLGGAAGSLIMILNSIIIHHLPAVYVTMLVFIGQIIAGMTIDYVKFGLWSQGKVVGGIIIMIGLYYYIKGDKKAKKEGF